MPKTKRKTIFRELLQTQNVHLQRLHDLVGEALEEEKSIVQNLANETGEKLTFGQRIADKVASFGGSWAFIITFLSILLLWIAFNVFSAGRYHFDPFPFILLNLLLSCIAALQAPVIMMSQNRTEEKDRQRSENDYLVNLKSELELRNLHQKVDLLIEQQMIKMMEVQLLQIRLLDRLNRKLKSQAQALAEHTGKSLPDQEQDEKIDFDALEKKLAGEEL